MIRPPGVRGYLGYGLEAGSQSDLIEGYCCRGVDADLVEVEIGYSHLQ